MRKVLELPAFRRLLAVTVCNQVAAGAAAVALALLVYHRTGSAVGATAFFLCAEFAPAFTSPFFVARLDQRSVRAVLTLLYASECVIFLVLAWLVGRFSVVPVLVLALLDGTFAVTARVIARSAWTSATAPVGLLREAAALVNSSASIAYMVGPALGGAVVTTAGTRAAMFVDAAIFAVMMATVATASGLGRPASERVPAAGRLRRAVSQAWAEPMIRRLLSLQAVAMFFFTLSIPVEVVLARHALHATAGGYGALLAVWGGGAIAGSGIYARWRGLPSRLLMTLGTSLLGLGFLLMGVAPALDVALVGAVIAGIGNGVQIVSMRTALQEAVPPDRMAMILSLNESMFQAVPGVGILVGGGIAALAGPRVALVSAAGGSLVVACLMWLRLAGTTDIGIHVSRGIKVADTDEVLTPPVGGS